MLIFFNASSRRNHHCRYSIYLHFYLRPAGRLTAMMLSTLRTETAASVTRRVNGPRFGRRRVQDVILGNVQCAVCLSLKQGKEKRDFSCCSRSALAGELTSTSTPQHSPSVYSCLAKSSCDNFVTLGFAMGILCKRAWSHLQRICEAAYSVL